MLELGVVDNVIESISRQAGARHQRQKGVHAIVFPFDDGRTQLVTVSHLESWTNRPMILFYSIVGPWTPELDLRPVLASCLRTNHARMCVVQDRFLAVSASLDLGEVDRARLFAGIDLRIREVALLADNLEQELFGRDEF